MLITVVFIKLNFKYLNAKSIRRFFYPKFINCQPYPINV